MLEKNNILEIGFYKGLRPLYELFSRMPSQRAHYTKGEKQKASLLRTLS
jgi:hypothetical protein